MPLTEYDIALVDEATIYVYDQLARVDHYPYHNRHHTLSVVERARYLCAREGLSSADTADVLIAALFHDIGFLVRYESNESIGAAMARDWLAKYGVSVARQEHVERIIMKTVLFTKPDDICEQIIQDSDLDNLGRRIAFLNTLLLYEEMRSFGGYRHTKWEWIEKTVSLLERFSFHTATARRERESIRKENVRLTQAQVQAAKDGHSLTLKEAIATA